MYVFSKFKKVQNVTIAKGINTVCYHQFVSLIIHTYTKIKLKTKYSRISKITLNQDQIKNNKLLKYTIMFIFLHDLYLEMFVYQSY